jgi:Helicase conserved C-terminal domain/SNF2-related domain
MSRVTAAGVLNVLSKARLNQLARELDSGLPPDAQKSAQKSDQIAGLLAVESALESLLPRLTRDELRAACRAHDLDHTGRSRAELMSRLGIALAPAEPEAERQLHYALGLPYAGDIAVVRHRQYMVERVHPAPEPDQQTRVELVCLDDDAAGRRLEVFWERELGARVIKPEDKGLGAVARLDPPRHFAAYLHALKWHSVTSTDGKLFQSPFRAGIKLMSHQLVPLMKALALPRANLFIADDVGLGKTIEAGLVMQELLLRQRVDQILIVCPASVCLQWQGEMAKRFGLRFEIYNRVFVGWRRQERGFGVNAWSTYPRFIISYQTLRRPEYRDLLLAHLGDQARRSLLVVDEAHNAAPASATRYAVDSNTTSVIRDVAPRFEHRLFLSATPHNGHSNSFSSLLEILDPQRFTRGVPVKDRAILEEVMVRRLKRDIKALQLSDDYPDRRVVQVSLSCDNPGAAAATWTAAFQSDAGHADAGHTRTLGTAGTADLALSELLRQYAAVAQVKGKRGRLAIVNLQKRLLSSIEAFARTIRRHAHTVAPDLDVREPQQAFDFGDFDGFDHGAQAETAGLSEEYGSEDDSEAEEARADNLAVTAPASARTLLAAMIDLAEQHRGAPSPKLLALVDWIRAHQCPAVAIGGVDRPDRKASKADRQWNDTRLIVFTEYADTKRYLRHLLHAAIDGSERAELRIMDFHGGMSDEQRDEVQRAFNGPPDEYPVRILLCTDAAREGVNLQGHCANLFHYDVPWNPGRIEQRNGRIDRTLQRAKEVFCHYFVYPQRVEDRVLQVLVKKVERIQRELGSLGTVIAERLAHALDAGIDESSFSRLDSAESLGGAVEQLVQTAADELESFAETERHRRDLGEANRILNRSRSMASFEISHLRDAIDVGLEMAGAGPLIAGDTTETRGVYRLPELPAGWERTLDTMRPPRKRDQEIWEWRKQPPLPVVFEAPASMTSDVVHLHLHHPFVQRILGRYLAQGYAANDLSRVTVIRNDQDALTRVIAFGRLTIYGEGASRLHEELVAVAAQWVDHAGGVLKPFAEEADRKAIEQLEALLARAPELAVSDAAMARLRDAAPRDFAALWPHVKAEAEAREHDAQQKLQARGLHEAGQLRQILERQRQAIQQRMDSAVQLDIFANDGTTAIDKRERKQFDDDLAHMRRRLDEMGSELEREPALVEKSYRPALHRLEPVGLVYLWPVTR